jgi:hypothetical protein
LYPQISKAVEIVEYCSEPRPRFRIDGVANKVYYKNIGNIKKKEEREAGPVE